MAIRAPDGANNVNSVNHDNSENHINSVNSVSFVWNFWGGQILDPKMAEVEFAQIAFSW